MNRFGLNLVISVITQKWVNLRYQTQMSWRSWSQSTKRWKTVNTDLKCITLINYWITGTHLEKYQGPFKTPYKNIEFYCKNFGLILISISNFSIDAFTLVIDLKMSFPYEELATETLTNCQNPAKILELKHPQEKDDFLGDWKPFQAYVLNQ